MDPMFYVYGNIIWYFKVTVLIVFPPDCFCLLISIHTSHLKNYIRQWQCVKLLLAQKSFRLTLFFFLGNRASFTF